MTDATKTRLEYSRQGRDGFAAGFLARGDSGLERLSCQRPLHWLAFLARRGCIRNLFVGCTTSQRHASGAILAGRGHAFVSVPTVVQGPTHACALSRSRATSVVRARIERLILEDPLIRSWA